MVALEEQTPRQASIAADNNPRSFGTIHSMFRISKKLQAFPPSIYVELF